VRKWLRWITLTALNAAGTYRSLGERFKMVVLFSVGVQRAVIAWTRLGPER
jgi:hypothetical protein